MRLDNTSHVINSRDADATFRQFSSRPITYHHHENAEHLSLELRESVSRLGRTYVALVDLTNSRFREYQVSRVKFVVPG